MFVLQSVCFACFRHCTNVDYLKQEHATVVSPCRRKTLRYFHCIHSGLVGRHAWALGGLQQAMMQTKQGGPVPMVMWAKSHEEVSARKFIGLGGSGRGCFPCQRRKGMYGIF